MTAVIPIKRRDATSLGEFVPGDQIASQYLILPPGYIDGLGMEWVSGTSLRVASGAAYVQGLGYVLVAPNAITKSGLSLTAATWYQVYLCLNGSTPDIEIVTTAPAAPYIGAARSKTGDTSRRYVGSLRTGSDGAILPFVQVGSTIHYIETSGAAPPYRVVANATPTAYAQADLSAIVPATSQLATCDLQNLSTNGYVSLAYPGRNVNLYLSPNYRTQIAIALNAQEFAYRYDVAPAGGGFYVDVHSYVFGR